MMLSNVQVTLHRHSRALLRTTSMLLVSLTVLIAPAMAQNNSAQVKLYNTAGNQVGSARLIQQGHGNVAIDVSVRDLPPGFHGFHVHTVGECIPPFTSSGGHFDLAGHTHRDHSGDFPVLLVNADGTANARFNTDRFAVADLFDGDGSALIIHAGPDNYANIPTRYVATPDATTLATGDAGARIACGVIEKSAARR
ncbi:MAG: superoxide dismutase family protein [Burkholderiales bacterium]|nr:superoxide dismutase family protein [Burkholderiales bacterium]